MFLYKNIEVSWKSIKSKAKVTMGTFLDLAHFSNYLQTKEIAWKRGDAIFLEPELIWSLLGGLWKILIQTKKINYKNLMLQIDLPKIVALLKNSKAISKSNSLKK